MVKSLNTAVSSISTLISPYLPAPSSDQYCSHFFCQKEKFTSYFSYSWSSLIFNYTNLFCIMSFNFTNSVNKTPKLPCMLPSSWSAWLFCRLAFAKPSSRNRGSLLWWDLYIGKSLVEMIDIRTLRTETEIFCWMQTSLNVTLAKQNGLPCDAI